MSHLPYANFVGRLMYEMVYTRTSIVHTMRVFSRFMSKLGNIYWIVIKRGLNYFGSTIYYGICYQGRHREDMCWVYMEFLT